MEFLLLSVESCTCEIKQTDWMKCVTWNRPEVRRKQWRCSSVSPVWSKSFDSNQQTAANCIVFVYLYSVIHKSDQSRRAAPECTISAQKQEGWCSDQSSAWVDSWLVDHPALNDADGEQKWNVLFRNVMRDNKCRWCSLHNIIYGL